MKTIVTGGTGFIGTHLINRLHECGHDITCLAKDRANAARFEESGVKLVECDLNEPSTYQRHLDGAEMIFHLAGVTRAKRTNDYYEGNYLATKHFVEACLKSPHLKRFICISSLTAIGPRRNGEEITESAEYHPVSHYGKSKMMAELEVLRAADRLPATVIRPAAVYGPGDRDLYQYYKTIRLHIGLIFGRTRKYLNMVYVSDLVDGIILAAGSNLAEGEIFLLGSDKNYSTEEICNTIALVEHVHPVKVRIPEYMGYVVGAVAGAVGKCTGAATLFNVQKAREAAQTAWTCSIEKARRILDFQPKIPLDEGIAMTYDWYRKNGWLPS
ncbi:MAG TPA: NAD-dependent epimerase/dehydratase family protein [Candidatus Kryptonia bacterium]